MEFVRCLVCGAAVATDDTVCTICGCNPLKERTDVQKLHEKVVDDMLDSTPREV